MFTIIVTITINFHQNNQQHNHQQRHQLSPALTRVTLVKSQKTTSAKNCVWHPRSPESHQSSRLTITDSLTHWVTPQHHFLNVLWCQKQTVQVREAIIRKKFYFTKKFHKTVTPPRRGFMKLYFFFSPDSLSVLGIGQQMALPLQFFSKCSLPWKSLSFCKG